MTQHIIRSCPPAASAAPPSPVGAAGRFTATQAGTVLAFPLMGCALHIAGTPVSDILYLLGTCGGIGVFVVLIAASGLRRLASRGAACLKAVAAAAAGK
ncbi:hypothetical protein ACH4A7_36000 [Streptomyces cyaneofuscatus]|uniref:hypothetical protein n=1 Tax=Streptomyces griseus group TaxID=629295 RepID=UPI002E3522B4|nr:hypothetical protein [Streptomyces microflavus]